MIINILKNGEIVPDLTGHVVNKEEIPKAYAVIERLDKEREEKK